MRPFIDLLPYRIDQALTDHILGRSFRAWRVRRRRRASIRSNGIGERTSSGKRRLYIDLAVVSRDDAGTGIQRVVRALALALIKDPSSEWTVQFIAADRKRPYHLITWPETGANGDLARSTAPIPIEAGVGDVFLGLDFSLDAVRRQRRQLARFRRNGASLWFVIYDLLPAERPDWFSPNNVIRFKAWLGILATIADGFLCISEQTQDDLRRVMDQRYGLVDGYRTTVLPMGYAIRESRVTGTADDVASPAAPMRFDTAIPFSLMVGTLEPRKGHADILAAFDEVWRRGGENRLVLVGRMGWHIEGLRDAIRTHPEHGRKLMWFDDVEDLELERIYRACEGVIIGSHAEGFGLPLIEALGYDKPVLARDLPIFRPHETLGVRYFPADAGASVLAECIQTWTMDVQAGRVAVERPKSDWKESARTILSALA